MRQDTFKNRYIIKLSSSIAVALLNIIVQLLLPRAFTVEEYGYYMYNLNVFSSVVVLLNLSSSNALISKFAKRNNEIGLIIFYLKVYLIEIIVLNAGVCMLFSIPFVREVFAGQTFIIVLLGLEVALLMKFQNDVVGVYDAMAVSRFPAIMQIVLKMFLGAYVLLFYFVGRLHLGVFYVGQLLMTASMVAVLLLMVIRFQKKEYPEAVNNGFINYLREYYEFCRPLVIASIVAQLITIVMNWALMKWSGATEQAMFGVAWQLNTLISLVFSPYAELSKREYAVVSGDSVRIRELYEKSLKMMLWVTSYFSLFIGFCANWLLPIVYGDKYSGALTVTLLIMIYTVYQAAGQINGSLMIALEKTRLNALLAVFGQIITFILIFVFQIPNFIWPNGLGAIGIAIVYVIGNIISTCVGIVLISKSLGIYVSKTLTFHWVPIIICSVLALLLNMGLDYIWKTPNVPNIFVLVFKTLIAGIIYSVVIFMIVLNKPAWMGVSSSTMSGMLQRVKEIVRWRH